MFICIPIFHAAILTTDTERCSNSSNPATKAGRSIVNFQGETSLDVDNIAKSLLDGLKGVLFRDDKQVSELVVRKSRFTAGLSLIGASPYLLDAIERMSQAGSDFVYVRADSAPDHGRIP